MSTFITQLKAVKVSAGSPEGAVTAERTADGYTFTINSDIARNLDEAALAGELEAAWTAAMRRYSARVRQIRAESRRNRSPSTPTAPYLERKSRYRDALTDIEVTRQSPRDQVRVGVYGDGDIYVTITPGAVMRMGGGFTTLTAEATEVVNAAMAEYRTKVREVHKEIYDRPGENHGR